MKQSVRRPALHWDSMSPHRLSECPNTAAGPRAEACGFTLIEALMVMTIVALVAAIGLPRVNAFRYKADAGIVQIRSLLMQAQRDAIVRQHDLLVSLDVEGSRLILGYDRNNDGAVVGSERIRVQTLPEETRFAAPPTPLSGSAGLNDFGAYRAVRVSLVSGLPTFVFRRDGSVSTPLEIYTTTRRADPRDYRVTTVEQATGRTAYQRYNGTSWKAP